MFPSHDPCPIILNDPVTSALPVILVVPIKVWVSVVSSPKIFEPEVCIVDAVMKDDVKWVKFKLSTVNWFVVES